jgi:hypothetical protein
MAELLEGECAGKGRNFKRNHLQKRGEVFVGAIIAIHLRSDMPAALQQQKCR